MLCRSRRFAQRGCYATGIDPSSALTAEAEERRRVAAELHDELGSSLTTIALGLQTCLEIECGDELRERIGALRTRLECRSLETKRSGSGPAAQLVAAARR